MYRYMKASRLHITRYICGTKLKSVTNSLVSTTNSWPTKFLYLKPYLTSRNGKRLVLTLMTLSKGISPNSKEAKTINPDFTPITDISKGRKYFIPRFFIDVMKRKYKISGVIDSPRSGNFFLNMKSSPTGVSITSCITASLQFTTDQLMTLLVLLKEEGAYYYWKCREFASWRPEYSLTTGVGKLSIVHDSEGKERVIAMLDYWSQWALKPIHDDLLNILRSIPMDRTFSQDPFHDWKDDDNKYWSLDLSSATDRFPLNVQQKVLSALYGKHIGDAWASLLIDRDYWKDGTPYRYSVGQPMGAYSSWAAFALTHHFTVQWAAYLCGHKDFRDYILLGDDIVIKNDAVARKYMGLMERWGVEVSRNKTHVSKDTYEFAKRWVHNSVEISPLPVKGLMGHFKEPKTVMFMIFEWIYKTNFYHGNTAYEIVKESYKRLRIGSQYCTETLMRKRLYDFWVGLTFIHEVINPTELKSYLISLGWSEEVLPNRDEIYDFTRRITDFSLSKVVRNVNLKVITMSEKFQKEMCKTTFSGKITNPNDISWHPIIHSLKNNLVSINNRLKDYKSTNEDIRELIKELTIPGVNEIVHLKRQVRKEVVGIDRLWKLVKVNSIVPKKDDKFIFDSLSKFNTLSLIGQAALQRGIQNLDTWCSGNVPQPVIELPLYWEIY